MFGFLLDVASTIISAVLPIYRTWKVLRTRRTTQLVPLAKYWTVFGLFTIAESVASMLYIPYIMPGYSLIKFASVIYICSSGYSQIFDHVIAPFLRDHEPTASKCLANASAFCGSLATEFFTTAVNYTLLKVSANNANNFAAYRGVAACRRTEQCMEVQEEEEDEVFYAHQDVKPVIANGAVVTECGDDSSDSVEIVEKKPKRRNAGRRRKT